jgi:N-acyl-D-amino-acid deacylase
MKPRHALLFLLFLVTSHLPVGTSSAIQTSPALSSTPVAIIGATLIDGTGRASLRDSVIVVTGDSITRVGRQGKVQIPSGARVIDAQGLVVAPGFIDAHNHSDRGFRTDPLAASQVSQGFTTLVIGQDGGSPFPIGDYLRNLDENPVAVNALTFLGHATLRSHVMGADTNRKATSAEIEKMKLMVEQSMREGAMGLSTGLEYETGKPATTDEVIALASVAGKFGGIYISHIRDEADKTFESIDEAIRIGKDAHIPVQISHIKLGSVAVWGRASELVARINKVRRRGQDVTADCYPYEAWSSTIRVLIPSGRHDDPVEVARGLADVGGPANITIVNCSAHPNYEFKTLEEISRNEGISSVDLFMKIVRDGGAGVVCHSMLASDIETFYRQPWVMVSSDGGIGSRHPRGAGTVPRVLGRFVREQKLITLEEAIRKLTSFPAARFKLHDRGLIKPGYKADLVLFNANQIIDRATFQEPQLISQGVERVFVNGVEVWSEGRTTGKRPGQALRRSN